VNVRERVGCWVHGGGYAMSLLSGPAHVATSREVLAPSVVRCCADVLDFSRPWLRVERACLDVTTVIHIDCGV
jgi:hypothetical protein